MYSHMYSSQWYTGNLSVGEERQKKRTEDNSTEARMTEATVT